MNIKHEYVRMYLCSTLHASLWRSDCARVGVTVRVRCECVCAHSISVDKMC